MNYLKYLIRTSISRCFLYSTLVKNKKAIEYLGCSIECFKDFIQKKMIDNMTFNNIHFDHIKPIDSFDLNNEQEFLRCCNYTNFQPLLVEDNREKSNKWTDENEVFWNENICGKEYFQIYYIK
jgi:uncharacterized protein (DUF1015 family)